MPLKGEGTCTPETGLVFGVVSTALFSLLNNPPEDVLSLPDFGVENKPPLDIGWEEPPNLKPVVGVALVDFALASWVLSKVEVVEVSEGTVGFSVLAGFPKDPEVAEPNMGFEALDCVSELSFG